ncbi:putative glycoside hydrolase [Paenibacillus montanisoli]|uniref:GTP-binding protein n=1 Tax=Paenibacillus montanisoli TaxID=2081970 RepID=A0A328TYS7_9BACL|nr:putative glycoside hydrolase [Paenibacillus montanisoli]RAP75540.1 GTP-binding protein [Paenibacillus montanisoli]
MDVIVSALLLLFHVLTGSGAQTGPQSASTQQLLTTIMTAPAAQQQQLPNGTAQPNQTKPGEAQTGTGTSPGTIYVKHDPQPDAPEIKGIYVTAHSAGGSRMESLLKLLDITALNSMVIDVKDDYGYITYPTQNPELLKLGKPKKYIGNVSQMMERLKKHNVYPIARIVVFKDTVLARSHPELSFRRHDGSVWQNGKKDSFVNPYRKEVWDYNIAIAKEAVKLGFKEIQFDYVRFPEGFEKKADSLVFNKTKDKRVDTIAAFVKYAKSQLEPLGVRVSVDIFGYAASVPAAEGIGQDFVKISKHVDVISPMVYPSHYSTGWFNVKDPDKNPYATIKGAMLDTHKKLKPIGSYKPIIRPWIQDFTASWLGKGHYIKYGKAEVDAQIKALNDTGIHEYLLWNANNRYTADANF